MYTRILVPLDGSPRAEAALPVAARLAQTSGGTLILTRIVNVNPELSPYFAMPVGSAPQLTYDIIDDAKAYLEQMRNQASVSGIPIETNVFLGMTAPALLEAITETKADMVVMCSHGRVGFARWALGSVAQHITRHSPVPVLVLREGKPLLPDAIAERGYPLRALVTLDGSKLAEAVLPHVITILTALAGQNGSEMHLTSVVSPFDLDVAGITQSAGVEAAQRYMDATVERLEADDATSHIRITSNVAVSRDIAGYLINIAEGDQGMSIAETDTSNVETTAPDKPHGGYDIMAMATHGRSGLTLWAVGSITERVLQSTRLPLFIVRPENISAEAAKPGETAIRETRELEDEINSWPGLL
ncbi:MAG: universal stress protein [Ktedonobacterales bacterium]